MRRLEDKLAAEGAAGNGKSSDTPMDKMMNHAKNLAGRLQDKLTGRATQRPRLTLKLADNSQDAEFARKTRLRPSSIRIARAKMPTRTSSMRKPATILDHCRTTASPKAPRQQNESQLVAAATRPARRQQRKTARDNSTDKSADQVSSDSSSNGGSAHGIGADPDTLFGATADPKMGGQGFEISIDARSETKGPKAAGHAYLPPKVRTPLNATQHPDEPIARASVPEEDRAAIKKVFER